MKVARYVLLFLLVTIGYHATVLVAAGENKVGENQPASLLIQGGTLIDGTGARRRHADVRIAGDSIQQMGRLKPLPGEPTLDARGLIVAPGFIDTHSHADGGLLEMPDAETQIRQGITTAVIGQDGFSNLPLDKFFKEIQDKHVALNLASFVGHGTIRRQVMGEDYKRRATVEELARMRSLVEQEMQSGALGLSSGLEYDPGFYATTEELIECAKAAARYGGIYISHVRDEQNGALTSFQEVIRIAQAARLPAQISHIKLGSKPVWGKAGEVLRLLQDSRKRGLDITADLYPYTYWRSTITAMMSSRDWDNRALWQKALDDVGGPGNVLLTIYTPEPSWAGKTLAQISQNTGQDAVTIIQQIIKNTRSPGATGREGVVVTAMHEDDLRRFITASPVMFCTDGGLRGGHPRGAGSYPRVLGRYVRDLRLLSLEAAIRKMTSLPARRMGFRDRGVIKPGNKADIVIFDASTIIDTATTTDPIAKPVGVSHVMVNGILVLKAGKLSGAHPGVIIRRTQTQKLQ